LHPNFNQLYDQDDLLTILLSDYIEPKFDKNKIIILYDYPVSQCALATIDYTKNHPVAKRFEVYYNHLELANGFYELADSKEQNARFKQDNIKRHKLDIPIVDYDKSLIAALECGLPKCSGVALGVDRLLMSILGLDDIEKVLTFR
jgi:Truncated, possibly inactive, lysyl-tRNA synthetase (class II)